MSVERSGLLHIKDMIRKFLHDQRFRRQSREWMKEILDFIESIVSE